MSETKTEAAKAAAPKRAKKAKAKRAVHASGQRKEAIARATLREGTGRVSVNKINLDATHNPLLKMVMREPLEFASADVDPVSIDVEVHVKGGGVAAQAQAVRTAIARALVSYSGSDDLKARFKDFDRSFLIEDARRVEPKKFKGPKARARFTKSYR